MTLHCPVPDLLEQLGRYGFADESEAWRCCGPTVIALVLRDAPAICRKVRRNCVPNAPSQSESEPPFKKSHIAVLF
jgi:hypothetical protein